MHVSHPFEDLYPGQKFETLGVTFTEDAIIRFGLEYDFQPFHVDKIAAKESMFGGLIASGFQTLALTFRLCNQAGLFTGNAVAGIGLEDVRFLRPVYAGDTIRVIVTISECKPSLTRPALGVVKWAIQSLNQDGRPVLSATLVNLVKRRDAQEKVEQARAGTSGD